MSRVAVFPDVSRYNPYQALLGEALARAGVEVANTEGSLTPAWVARARGRFDAVHLHWLEVMAFDPKRRYPALLDTVRTLRLWLSLKLLRRSPLRVVWTAHNIRPHELSHPLLYRLLEREAARTADAVLVHSEYAADAVRRELRPRGEVRVAYHGHYVGWYPAAGGSREELRAGLGLPPGSFVYLLFGQVRPYKRVADAIRTFRGLDGDDLRMLVAGQLKDERDRREVEALAASDPRVVLELRWIADEEVDGFHRASDVVVLNYPEIFSSGALLLAWSLGRPVVAPEGGTVTELAAHGPIETFAPGGLAGGLERARTRWPNPAEGEAPAAAERFGWDEMAAELRELYEGQR